VTGETRPARVVGIRSRQFTILLDGERQPAVVPKKLRFRDPDVVDPVAVGDLVHVTPDGNIESVQPRRNSISRPASGRGGRRQILAANVDLALIVQAAGSPVWKPSTFDRYLVLASAGGVPPAVCLNKIDLDPEAARDPAFEVYAGIGIPRLAFSTITGEGFDAVIDAVRGRTCVLLGPSGVGKSSIVNRLFPEHAARVGEISERTGKGTHTTTWVELLDLPGGGGLVDSPGLRVLDLTGVPPAELSRHFPEFGNAAPCRYPDCAHLAEPECAVKAAVSVGSIDPGRYDSYVRIHASLSRGWG